MIPQPSIGHFDAVGSAAGKGVLAYDAGTGAATVTVPAGAWLKTVSVVCTTAPGTVKIGTNDTVTVPVGSSFSQDVGGGIQGQVDVVISASDAYYVDWIAP